MEPRADAQWHALDVGGVVELIGGNVGEGLAADEAARRLARDGANDLPVAQGRSRTRVMVDQFRSPLVYVLVVAAAATIAVGHGADALVILGVVLVNAGVGFVQEWRAGQALAALADLTGGSARVLRDGCEMRISASDLVVGDVVLMQAGDRVPADLRLVDCHDLRIDEAHLTGESLPVHKSSDQLDPPTPLADRTCMAYSGTLVTTGRGLGVVVATGQATQIGGIHALIQSADDLETPLTHKLTRFSRWITIVILVLAAITFTIGVLRGESPAYMITAAIALAVGAIPEGLPAVVTITLAIGVSRMARRRAIIRRLPAVETLGSVTVICTDKTGTLTQNQMTAQSIYADGQWWPIGPGAVPEPVGECLLAGLLCNDASIGSGIDGRKDNVGDPTELALISAAHRASPELIDRASAMPRRQEIPFTSELRMMATVHRVEGANDYLVAKGALEEILALCDIAEPLRRDIERAAEEAGDEALRIMAFAAVDVARDFVLTLASLREARMRFVGLQALQDPPRPTAVSAVAACSTAGVDVKMITGDHARTARAIASQVGLAAAAGRDGLRVLTGAEMEQVAAEDAPAVIAGTQVFARVTAEQKLSIVRVLQEAGQVVAMTGDGVNDAPAVKQADIGIAMGRDGTEVAKETADMVLVDDDFATIEAAVEEGRTVYDNLMKFIVWTLPTNICEGLIVLVSVVMGATLPILPMQILWINMTTAITLGMMLAFEPPEPDVMKRPPRLPSQQLITGRVLRHLVVAGAVMLLGVYAVFTVAMQAGMDVDEARTMAVNALVAMEIAYLFACRSLSLPQSSIGYFSNRWIWVGSAAMVVLQMGFTYLPLMQVVFRTAAMAPGSWIPVLALAPLMYAIPAGMKRWDRRTSLFLRTRDE